MQKCIECALSTEIYKICKVKYLMGLISLTMSTAIQISTNVYICIIYVYF